jgi:acyl-coenzyme A thioesterase PaaI-like protein
VTTTPPAPSPDTPSAERPAPTGPPPFGDPARLERALAHDHGLPPGHARAQIGAVDQARRVIDGLRVSTAPPAVHDRVAALLAEAADLLAPHRHPGPYVQAGLVLDGAVPTLRSDHDPHAMFPYSPICGWLNPLAVPATWRREGDGGVGTVRMPAAGNGPQGMVHGGIIAAIFDELLGTVAAMHGLAGFTGTLTVRYRNPTPIEAELDLAADVDRVEGRKTFVRGTIHHDGVLCAEAEAIFVRTADAPLPAAAERFARGTRSAEPDA